MAILFGVPRHLLANVQPSKDEYVPCLSLPYPTTGHPILATPLPSYPPAALCVTVTLPPAVGAPDPNHARAR